MKTLRTYSSKETRRFGERIAKRVKGQGSRRRPRFAKASPGEQGFGGQARVKSKGALVFALEGELGSGKTTFVQGFFRGLGIKKRSPSPTFIIFRRFAISHSPFANLYHVDAYRIKKPRELLALGFREILVDPQNLVLVEWADRIKRILPKHVRWIRFRHGRKENERIIDET